MQSFRNALSRRGSGADAQQGQLPDLACCSLSYKQRIIGFISCFAFGWLISFVSFTSLSGLSPKRFAVLYTLGNLTSLAGTCFLLGPVRQIKSMTSSNRWIAASIYVFFMILTLFAAFKDPVNILLVVLCVLGQFSAAVWYSLSYIPFARAGVKRILGLTNM